MSIVSSDTELPKTATPLSTKKFLEEMSTDLPGAYLLGSLNRHITVYSQQKRAVNLIHALMHAPGGLDGKEIAIVGGGFAGLTAAAYALEETTAHVTLFDAAPRPLWLQDNCANRWLHPGIYDWPLRGSLEPCTQLPVLNWRAGAACDVARHVRAQWERIASTKGRLKQRLETRVTSLTPCKNGGLILSGPSGKRQSFDVVVLAVGFGLEPDEKNRVAYWNDADGLDGIRQDASVLVVGFGDGGLADLLRLCLPETRQDNLVELVRLVPPRDRRTLVDKDRDLWDKGAELDEYYKQLRVEPIIERIASASPSLARVTLAGKGHIYGPGSAILNRFLVSQLRQARGDEAFELKEETVDLDSITELPGGRRSIKFTESGRQEFDYLVVRSGPQPAFERISPLDNWEVGKTRRTKWMDTPQSQDRTRVSLNPLESDDASEGIQDFLAFESSARRWCLVVHPPGSTVNWSVHTTLALEKSAVDKQNSEPLVLCAQDAICSKAAIRDAVRALCSADILIADVTDFDPSVMLMLGIRAAVRRGVTIACTTGELSARLVENLPFNLRELNLVSFHKEDEGHEGLVAAIIAGVKQSGVSTRYLDLPVYDYVREEADVDPQYVLFLRPYEQYDDDGARRLYVHDRILKGLKLNQDARVEAIIDQTSPRLAEQRLYEAIRHWNTCVVDLTWWRPNVLFELGVRLAVRRATTFTLIDETAQKEDTYSGSRQALRDLLGPLKYNLKTVQFAFNGQEPNLIYETAALHFRKQQDHYDERVDGMLIDSANVTPGHDDPLQAVDITPLYASDNRDYGDVVRHSVFERLCAAWCYLADRQGPHKDRPIDLLDMQRLEAFRRFRNLSSRLKTSLAQRFSDSDKRFRGRIERAEESSENSRAVEFAELLDTWLTVRSDPPWLFEVAKTTKDDINDCEDYVKQLIALEVFLTELGSPVCELPLQGIRSDLRRLKVALECFKERSDD